MLDLVWHDCSGDWLWESSVRSFIFLGGTQEVIAHGEREVAPSGKGSSSDAWVVAKTTDDYSFSGMVGGFQRAKFEMDDWFKPEISTPHVVHSDLNQGRSKLFADMAARPCSSFSLSLIVTVTRLVPTAFLFVLACLFFSLFLP